MIGMGERTTPMGVEALARRLFATPARPSWCSRSSCPRRARRCTWTPLLTMVDLGTFVAYPYLDWSRGPLLAAAPGDDPADLDVQQSRRRARPR